MHHTPPSCPSPNRLVVPFKEESFFFECLPDYLYGVHNEPRADASHTSIVIVPPIGHERLRCYRESVNLARGLADQGFHVLRFDYRGEGESAGSFEHTNVATRLHDIEHAIKALGARNKIAVRCLIGFRLGAVLAMMASVKMHIDRVVLCDPVLNIKSYVRSLFRANIIMQREYFGKIICNEQGLRERLQSGDPISIYGFHYTNGFIQQMEAIDERECLHGFKGQSLLLPFTRVESPANKAWEEWLHGLNRNGHCTLTPFITDFSWGTKKIWTSSFHAMDTLIAEWLSKEV